MLNEIDYRALFRTILNVRKTGLCVLVYLLNVKIWIFRLSGSSQGFYSSFFAWFSTLNCTACCDWSCKFHNAIFDYVLRMTYKAKVGFYIIYLKFACIFSSQKVLKLTLLYHQKCQPENDNKKIDYSMWTRALSIGRNSTLYYSKVNNDAYCSWMIFEKSNICSQFEDHNVITHTQLYIVVLYFNACKYSPPQTKIKTWWLK